MDVVSPPPPITCVMENILYVAVGEGVKQNKPLLLWALKYSGGRKICIMHVHRPANTVPIMGTKFPASRTNERELRAYQAIQRQKMLEILDEYRQICCRRREVMQDPHVAADGFSYEAQNLRDCGLSVDMTLHPLQI